MERFELSANVRQKTPVDTICSGACFFFMKNPSRHMPTAFSHKSWTKFAGGGGSEKTSGGPQVTLPPHNLNNINMSTTAQTS